MAGPAAVASAPLDNYDIGDPVPLSLAVADADGDPLDVDTATLVIIGPADGAAPVDVDVEHPDLGLYTAVARPDAAGIWRARWTTTGIVESAQEFAFVVAEIGAALPFAATVEGVRARVLDVAKPAGAVPTGGAPRAPRVPESRIVEWLLEGGARVARKLRQLTSIGASEADPVRLEYRAAARGLTELYAAALLWDATYPQAAKGERYGAVLFERFEKGLAELAADLAVDFDNQPAAVPGGGELDESFGGRGAAAIFPVRDPRIGRWHPW